MPERRYCPRCKYELENEMMWMPTDALKHALSNLLATIHHDGGHYEVKHGTLKAVEDAKESVIKERELFDAYKYQMSSGTDWR